jgi:lysophospholipase L1-like esterase
MSVNDESMKGLVVTSEPSLELDSPSSQTTTLTLTKPVRTILLTVLLMLLPLIIPRLGEVIRIKGQSYREMLPNPAEMISFKGSQTNPTAADVPGVTVAGSGAASEPIDTNPSTVETGARDVVDPNYTLDSFYLKLALTDARQPGAITRISHYGDSPVTNDGITAPARRLLQERFGDAGHGFILVDRPWAWYDHQAIDFSSGGGWLSDSMMNPRINDGVFGLGGVSSRATGPGKFARFAPADSGDTGKSFSRMEVYFLRQPNGGQFNVSVNGTGDQIISTSSESAESGFSGIKAPESGPNTFEIRTLQGNVRLFGAVIENDGPGIIYDSLGVNGAYAGLLATVMNEQHWAAQLQHRNPDLLILNYGTNESQYASDSQMARYDQDLREVISRIRTALPKVAILVVSPMDRGTRSGGKVVTLQSIPKIVELQRRVALESNCAFFNLFSAMGGEGTMARWHEGKDRLVGGDLTHPTAIGAEKIGSLIYSAIMDGYTSYQSRNREISTKNKANQRRNSDGVTPDSH